MRRLAALAAGWMAGVIALAFTSPANLSAAQDQDGAPANAVLPTGATGAAAAATAVPATGHQAGAIEMQTAQLTYNGTTLDYDLGTIWVPENRSDPHSRLISIGFARVKSPHPQPAPPTFHLPGGPGGSYLNALSRTPTPFLRFLSAGDVVIVDQRGFSTHGDVLRYRYNNPAEPLDRPGSLAQSIADFEAVSKEAIADCAKKSVDLRGYTVKECAEDVEALRRALGYKQITLVGTSFGSQWSFAIMRLHPDSVARALLSGVEPLNMGFDSPSGVYAAAQRVFAAAETDPRLKPYLPPGGLDAAVKAILARLDKAPVKVIVKSPAGDDITVVLGKADFQRTLVRPAADLPRHILSIYHEQYDGWAQAAFRSRQAHAQDIRIIGPCIDSSLSVTPARLKQLKADPATAILGEWNWSAYIATAELWPSPDVGDDFRTPVQTDIPVVFAQGDWDFNTPVENTLEITRSFPHSRVLIADHGGHGVIEPVAQRCPAEWDKIMRFVATGELPELPAHVSLPRPDFLLPAFPAPNAGAAAAKTGGAESAKGTGAAARVAPDFAVEN